jgi:putative two-component system response regulator
MGGVMTLSEQGIEQTVLVVDDTKENLNVIGHLLRPFYHVRVANSGARALEIAASLPQPDLILLDVMMPEMDGYQVLTILREQDETREIPVIFVTAMDDDDNEEHGLSLGAVDYISKPVKPMLLLARVKAHLELKASRDRLANQNAYLDAEVYRRTLENEVIKDFSLHALASLAEKRDNETGNHLHRTKSYIEVLMERLKDHPRFASQLTNPEVRKRIAKAAPLHDIGKVGIPDGILLKPGKLTPEEFEIMKTHATIGVQAIEDAIKSVSRGREKEASEFMSPHLFSASALDFLEVCKQIAGGHHEKWDGSGYPLGLMGEQIPLPARLMAIADVFDALISRRHYKLAHSLDETIAIISEGRGRHFDPDIVDAFLEMKDEIVAISEHFSDPEEDVVALVAD